MNALHRFIAHASRLNSLVFLNLITRAVLPGRFLFVARLARRRWGEGGSGGDAKEGKMNYACMQLLIDLNF